MSKFQIGDTVCTAITSRHDYAKNGKVLQVMGENEVLVEWENRSSYSYGYGRQQNNITRENVEDLMTEEEVQAKKDELQAAFDKLETDLRSKFEAAAKLLDEANAEADAAGIELSELYEATRPLLRAMDRAGWSTSSLSC